MQDTSKQIMIVEDSPTEQRHMSLMLEQGGYSNIVAADDASAAIILLETTTPDLFIIDVLMPSMDGLELCKEIRASAHVADKPIIVVSAQDDPKNPSRATAVGANDYMTKPMVQYDLIMKVSRLLDSST